MKKKGAWFGIALGSLWMLGSIPSLFSGGDGFLRGVSIPAWVEKVVFLLGLMIFTFGLWSLFRKVPPSDTNAEAAKAKAKMDQMYFNEYGVWPDYKEEAEVLPENQAESGQPNTGTEAGNANLKPTSPAESKPPVD